VGIFVLTFLGGTLKEIWVSGNWGKLVSFKVFFAAGLYVFSFFIPKMIKKIKDYRAWRYSRFYSRPERDWPASKVNE
jgi:hypothetical protein